MQNIIFIIHYPIVTFIYCALITVTFTIYFSQIITQFFLNTTYVC